MDVPRGSSVPSRDGLCVNTTEVRQADWGEESCWVPLRFATFHATRMALALTLHRVAALTALVLLSAFLWTST